MKAVQLLSRTVPSRRDVVRVHDSGPELEGVAGKIDLLLHATGIKDTLTPPGTDQAGRVAPLPDHRLPGSLPRDKGEVRMEEGE